METHTTSDRNSPTEAGDQPEAVTEAEHTAEGASSIKAADRQHLPSDAELKQSETAAPGVAADGQLLPPGVPVQSDYLKTATLAELAGALLERIRQDIFCDNEETISLGCQILEALRTSLDEQYYNRFSTKRYRGLFETYYKWVGPPRPRIQEATVVDIGCGSVNPFGILFLFLMLGARRGIAVDSDEIQNWSRATSAMAESAGLMVIDPGNIVGDYPITGKQVLDNIASFDLARMRLGDRSGLDRDKLVYLQEPASALSIGSSEVDILVSNAFLEHLSDVEGAIAEMARITRPGGYGIHNIDGSDHRRYTRVECHPLAFLEEDTNKPLVYGSNRIRPLEFGNIFRRHGFEMMDFQPFERVEVNGDLRERMIEPFRSLEAETLSIVQCKFVLRKA